MMYADGGSRGNPGPAGSGAIVRDHNGKTVLTVSEFLGTTTNNVAEYTAVLRGLEKLIAHLGDASLSASVSVRMDSMLVVKQMNGEYKIKHPNLIPLARAVSQAAGRFQSVSFEHVYREQNKDADALANAAMDAGMGRRPGVE